MRTEGIVLLLITVIATWNVDAFHIMSSSSSKSLSQQRQLLKLHMNIHMMPEEVTLFMIPDDQNAMLVYVY